MKTFIQAALLIVVIASCSQKPKEPTLEVKKYWKVQMDSVHFHLSNLKAWVEEDKPAEDLQQAFMAARVAYKKVESLNTFHFAGLSDFMNGPALDEADEYDDKVIEATGFQVVEELIFPDYDSQNKDALLQEINALLSSKQRFDELLEGLTLSKENTFEALRLQLIRIISLGITGFDSPVAFQSIPEAAASLEGTKYMLSLFHDSQRDASTYAKLMSVLDTTLEFLSKNTSFDDFNRAAFITRHVNPLAKAVLEYQVSLGIDNNPYLTALNMRDYNLFSDSIVNRRFFLPFPDKKPNDAMLLLGKTLFFDPLLSGNAKRSCASCHQPGAAFTDQKRKNVAFNFSGEITRNTPTLINAAYQKSQFWDQRIQFLEDQVTDVVSNADEMHGNMNRTFDQIMQSNEYKKMMVDAFGNDAKLGERNVREAIAAYIRSLSGMNSRFDQYMRGDETKLSSAEVKGFNLFMGKAKCATCHFLPFFNGTVPPNMTETEAEILAVPASRDTVGAKLDPDLGKYMAYKRDLFKYAFKTPTVRNAALTAPYMHNGVYETLEEVMDFYNRGGGAGLGIDLETQTLPPDRLNLSAGEKTDIIAFIHALTDTTALTSLPQKLPAFGKQVLDKRKIGGEY